MDCSYGFRPRRSAHDAVRELHRIAYPGHVRWIIEADIVSFFDSLDRAELKKMLRCRIADGSLMRLIGKCLRVGILDGFEVTKPDMGATQGSVLSPILGNLYLHHVLDLWFEQTVKPRLRGQAHLIRYCDDFILTFEREDDAQRVYEVLSKRFQRYGLDLHPEKTRMIRFQRPPPSQRSGKGPSSFDFLGFSFFWGRTHQGFWMMRCKTKRANIRRTIMGVYDWCRRHRHLPVHVQRKALCRRVQGHLNYFSVNGNRRCLRQVVHAAECAWYKWLRRRGQRRPLSWTRFHAMLKEKPLPKPRILVQIWGSSP